MREPGWKLAAGFQFLLGRLETKLRRKCKSLVSRFQFLLGRLETDKVSSDELVGRKFQFLLGRLETVAAVAARRTRKPSFNSS